MPDVYCPPVTDERGKSSDDPCTVWCGGADYDAWKQKSQQRIAQALMRQDLGESTRAQLREWNQQIETLPRSKVDSGNAVRMMASIARQAECIALATSKDKIPPLVQVEKVEWYKRKEIWILIALILGGSYVAVKVGALKALARQFKRKRK